MPLRNGSRRDELERIRRLKSDKTFEKADLLKALAIKLIDNGEKEEARRVLDLASEEIINSGRRLTSQRLGIKKEKTGRAENWIRL